MDAARFQEPRRRRVTIANRWGEGEMALLDFGDPDRPVDLLFVHANGFNALTYRALLAPLSASLRIVAPDLRGHGATSLPADPRGRRSWADLRDDLISLLDLLGGPPLTLAGHSMGATSALLAAERRPGRVANLVLLDPVIWPRLAQAVLRVPGLTRFAASHAMARSALRRRRGFPDRPAAFAAYRGRGAFAGWPETVLADYVAGGFVEAPEGGVTLACDPAWEAANYAAQANDPWGALARLSRPVAILKAETGSTCAVEPRHAARRPGLSVARVPGGTHFFPMTAPEAARELLMDMAV